jgi:Fe2+ or Zn2+ uptake regulation protein
MTCTHEEKVWRHSRYNPPLCATHRHLICVACGAVFEEEELSEADKTFALIAGEMMKAQNETVWVYDFEMPRRPWWRRLLDRVRGK